MRDYIARRTDKAREQLLINHLEGVAHRARENASAFGAGELAYACGLAHDIGKYSAKFQERIRGKSITVDHSTAGGKLLFEAGNKSALAMIAAYCCMGHHGGLPDGGTSRDGSDESTLWGRIQRDIEDYTDYKSEIANVPALIPPGIIAQDGFSVAFFVRMLFSALVDADFIDTETFMENQERGRGGFADIDTLNKLVAAHIERFIKPASEVSFLNTQRTMLLKSCLSAAENPTGIFTLTAPTGSGKTVSGLAFAFKHAVANGKRRVVYIAPYNTIIEQNAAVFEKILGQENVLRHYGNYSYDDKSEESSNKRYSSENWDFPMIVTSSVQFFESLFARRPSVCRKLHNIADSVIIFDEAQMIPVPLLKPCVRAITELVNNYGCTAVLATATQVNLKEYLGNLAPIEIVENPVDLHNKLRRSRIQVLVEPLEDQVLAGLLAENEQVLCVVNTRRHAQELFEKMRRMCGEGVFHLSTTLYPAHRKRILEEIRDRLKLSKPARVVSASMIEAGVDVDFPVVYRAAAGLDSVVQAAGRCNREGHRLFEESIVYVFTPKPGEHDPPRAITPNIAAAAQIAQNFDDLASPEAMTTYFEQLFYNKGDKALDDKGILAMFNDGGKTCSFPFRQVAEIFRVIDDSTKTVYVLHEVPELVKRLQNGERSRELFRELANYAISLYEHTDIKKLWEIGALVWVGDDVLVVGKEYYDENFGVHLSPEGGIGIMS